MIPMAIIISKIDFQDPGFRGCFNVVYGVRKRVIGIVDGNEAIICTNDL